MGEEQQQQQQHQEEKKKKGEGHRQTSTLSPTSDPATSSLDGERNKGRSKDTYQGKNEKEEATTSPSAQGGGDNSETEDASNNLKIDDDQPPLPFSKARCIALVATLTGASFLNASLVLICISYTLLQASG